MRLVYDNDYFRQLLGVLVRSMSLTSGLWFFFRPPESVAFRAAALLPPASPPHPNFQSLINPPRLIGFWIGNLGGKWVELMWTPLEH